MAAIVAGPAAAALRRPDQCGNGSRGVYRRLRPDLRCSMPHRKTVSRDAATRTERWPECYRGPFDESAVIDIDVVQAELRPDACLAPLCVGAGSPCYPFSWHVAP